jgi:hypothetical protein
MSTFFRPLTGLVTSSAKQQLATTTAVPHVNPLDQLAEQFRFAHSGIEGGIRSSVEAQIECGRLLEEMQALIKEKVGLGYWSAWVQSNCGVTLRQVQRYIQKWREYSKVCQGLGSEATSMSLLAQGDLLKLEGDKKRKRRSR